MNDPLGDADFWDPGRHPWQVEEGSHADVSSRASGYDDQRALIAQHVLGGGRVDTAPYPSPSRYIAKFYRPTLEGIRQARIDAYNMLREGLYDAEGVLEDVAAIKMEEAAEDAAVDGGWFELPVDIESARIHTTVTRLFTDPVVYDVAGESFTPKLTGGCLMPFHGRLHVCGHQDIDVGIDLDGEYKVDLIDAGAGGPGAGDPVLRLLWGSESAIVGAIRCGTLRTWGRAAGIGPSGASEDIRHRLGDLPDPGDLALIESPSGVSAWSAMGGWESTVNVFLAVDESRRPQGLILDDSTVTSYYWYEEQDGEIEAEGGEWPADAREFNPLQDREGANPNQGISISASGDQ